MNLHCLSVALAALLAGSSAVQQVKAASFFPTGAMGANRRGHAAVLLPSGKVLVAGGYGVTDTDFLSSAEVYDPASSAWTATATSMVAERVGHTITVLPNGKVLVAGGYNSASGYLMTSEIYDPTTGRWTSTGTMKTNHASATATLLQNGKVLVAGGLIWVGGVAKFIDKAELYDSTSGTWTVTGSLGKARSLHTASLLPNGNVLVAGGTADGQNGIDSTEVYNPSTGTWTLANTLHTARFYHAATPLSNGKVLVAGGYYRKLGLHAISSAEIFDPATGAWSVTGSLNTARYFNTATLLAGGEVLTTGGWDATGAAIAGAELYSPSSGTWSPTASMTIGRAEQTATLLTSGIVLVTGGTTPSGSSTSSAELFVAAPITSLIKAVKPAFSYLSVGSNYQLQVSGNMSTWTNSGLPFTATAPTMSYPQYWDVDNYGTLFFRVQLVP